MKKIYVRPSRYTYRPTLLRFVSFRLASFVLFLLCFWSILLFQDLKDAQPALGRGLQQLLDFDGDVESTFARTFQISYEVLLP